MTFGRSFLLKESREAGRDGSGNRLFGVRRGRVVHCRICEQRDLQSAPDDMFFSRTGGLWGRLVQVLDQICLAGLLRQLGVTGRPHRKSRSVCPGLHRQDGMEHSHDPWPDRPASPRSDAEPSVRLEDDPAVAERGDVLAFLWRICSHQCSRASARASCGRHLRGRDHRSHL